MTAPEQNDTTGPVHPPVIDVEAEDVTPAAASEPAATAESDSPIPQSPPPKPRKRHWGRWGVVVLLILAVGLGAWLYRDYGQRFWPSDQMIAMAQRISTLEAAGKTLNDQLAGLGSAIDALKSSDAKLGESATSADQRLGQAESDVAALKDSNTSVTSRLEQAVTAIAELRSGIDTLKQSIVTAGDKVTVTAPDPAALAALSERVAAIEREVAALKAESSKPNEGAEKAALLSQTLAELKAKFVAGAAYQEELDKISGLVPAAPSLDQLKAHAATGLPDAKMLADQLGALVPALPARQTAGETTSQGGYWDYLMNLFGSVVTVRIIGETDWHDVGERAQAYAEAGDLTSAIDLIGRSEGEVPAALAAWRNMAQARIAGETALEDVSAAVLRELATIESKP